MPKIEGTMLSAGCAGLSFFNWIDEHYGKIKHHIGIELYSPKPANLPDNIEWIANTVGNMCDVKDASCELVFSGQNIEHLWADEMVGFFLESWRVLKPGGYLVVDSPNRALTEPLVWSHPEHTVEFTPAEACRLAELAGFDITTIKGIWLCRDKTGHIIPFDPKSKIEKSLIEERLRSAEDQPDNSFIWWLEAQRSERAPDPVALQHEITTIFDKAWPERTRRLIHRTGKREDNAISAKKNERGALIFGPFMPLKAGNYRVSFKIHDLPKNLHKKSGFISLVRKLQSAWCQLARSIEIKCLKKLNTHKWNRYIHYGIKIARRITFAEPVVRFDIIGNHGREIIVKELFHKDLVDNTGRIELEFSLNELEFGIQTRCLTYGKIALSCELPINIQVISREK
jgi:SAM-dependent methyltransferase